MKLKSIQMVIQKIETYYVEVDSDSEGCELPYTVVGTYEFINGVRNNYSDYIESVHIAEASSEFTLQEFKIIEE